MSRMGIEVDGKCVCRKEFIVVKKERKIDLCGKAVGVDGITAVGCTFK